MMMKVLHTIRKYFCYCGIEKEEFRAVKKNAYVSNFEVWRILHFLMDLVLAAMFLASFANDFLGMNMFVYMGGLIYSVLATVLFFVLKKDSIIAQFLIYLSISVLFLFGCFITANKPNIPAITFIAFLLLTPMFMIDKPYFMSIELIVASTVFLIWMYFVKTPEIWRVDLVNTIVFTFVGIMIHIIVNSIRIKEFVLIRKINIQKDIDELTGLKNKGALSRAINKFLQNGSSDKGLFFVLDIDYFKKINDTYGHDEGDVILTELGAFLKGKFTGDEIVGRFGGDEFIIFIKDIDDPYYAETVALDIHSRVPECIKLPGGEEGINVSMGVAIYRGEEKNYSEIFKKADIALYKVKADRSLKFDIYD